ncbi:MAG TPA: hypothetical protein VGB30_04060 [bacterium]|jgi:hypothetical protein
MNKILKALSIIILTLFLGTISAGFIGSTVTNPEKPATIVGSENPNDPPWDPGDEHSGLDGTHSGIIILAKKHDPPWDPGDESTGMKEADHA